MGSCSSIHKDPHSAIKFRLYFTKSDKYVVPSPPPVKTDKQPLVNAHRPIPTTFSADFGSKEETFFDSQPWLESDCEDDFFSVNGDFTPSRGSTPVHHVFAGTPRTNKGPFGSHYQPEPSPNTKKRLSDLFRESIRDDLENEHENAAGDQNSAATTRPPAIDIPPKSVNDDTPFHSGATSVCSSERTPRAEHNNHKSLKSMQCCMPRLLSSRSFEKKNSSPVYGHE